MFGHRQYTAVRTDKCKGISWLTRHCEQRGEIARFLADRGIHVWSGHFYALEPIARLGLTETGGLVRVGLCHYATTEEVEYLLEALRTLTR